MDFVKYIPAWNGNRAQAKPITVEVKPRSRKQIMQTVDMIRTLQSDGFPDANSQAQEKQFCESVGRIENLNDLITGLPILNGRDLYDAPGYNDLVVELIQASESISKLTEGIRKNSAPPSAGV